MKRAAPIMKIHFLSQQCKIYFLLIQWQLLCLSFALNVCFAWNRKNKLDNNHKNQINSYQILTNFVIVFIGCKKQKHEQKLPVQIKCFGDNMICDCITSCINFNAINFLSIFKMYVTSTNDFACQTEFHHQFN